MHLLLFQKQSRNFGMLGIDDHRKLIISGPYQYSRNPLYVGIVLITLGFALLAGSFVGLILTFYFYLLGLFN